MMSNLKVVHLTSAHPRKDVRIFFKMCTSLARYRFNVSLIVADNKGDECFNNINIYDVGKIENRLIRMISVPRKILKKAIFLDADLYHFHDPELIPIGIKLLRLGKKVIFDSHEDVSKQILSKQYIHKSFRKSISRIYAKYESFACKKFSGIVAATPIIRDKFLKINSNTIDINNFPDLLISGKSSHTLVFNIKDVPS